MKTDTHSTPTFPNTLLTVSILFAQIDMHGLYDYALKACIGGAIWLGYKVIADRIDRHRKSKEATNKQTEKQ
jgi:hypothetical protein